MDDKDLVDVGKLSIGYGSMNSFSGRSHVRLDQIYLNVDLSNLLSNYNVKRLAFSDTCLVAVAIGQSEKPKSNFVGGLW